MRVWCDDKNWPCMVGEQVDTCKNLARGEGSVSRCKSVAGVARKLVEVPREAAMLGLLQVGR